MSWMDDLPAEIAYSLSDEIKTNPTLSQYNTMEDMLTGHINTKSALGRSIRIPGDDAGESDKQEFYQKLINNAPDLMVKPDFSDPTQSEDFYRTLGKPEENSKYENPEGFNLDTEVEGQLRDVLYGANLTNAQYQEVVSKLSSMQDQTVENNQLVQDQAMKGLSGKWGATTESRMQAAQKINEEFYPGRNFDGLTPNEIESLYSIHTSVTGTGPQAPGQPSPPAGMTPHEAEEQAAEIMRRVHDPKSELDHGEKMRLINKRVDILKKFVPKFAEEA